MKVLILAKSRENPSTRYRVDPLAAELRAEGCVVDFLYEAGFLEQITLLLRISRYDLVLVQRKLFSSTITKMLGSRSRCLVFDFDDAVFLKSTGEVSRTRSARFDAMLRASDWVFAGNDYLAGMCKTSNVSVVPTTVDSARYGDDRQKDSQFSLVWIGSKSTSRYLEAHRSALEAIGKSIPGIRLKVIGDFDFQLQQLEVVNVPWSEADEVAQLASAHVGIAPMTDNAWTRGKCALKVIQYMAAGLPVISSDVGANGDIVEPGKTGLLVRSDDDWIQAVKQLRQDTALLTQMGQAGRSLANEHFDMTAVHKKSAQFLLELAGKS